MSAETLKTIVQHAESWPQEDQDELASYARIIETRRTGHYRVTEAERAALAESMMEADQSEFVPDTELATARKRHTG